MKSFTKEAKINTPEELFKELSITGKYKRLNWKFFV